MRTPAKLRLIAAIVLVCSAFLPLSECTRSEKVSPPLRKSMSERLFPRTNPDFTYQYVYENIDLSFSGTLAVLAFTWPLIFLFLARRRFGFRLRLFLQVLEVLLCSGTIYLIYAFTLSGFGARWLYGAYVGIIAVAVFTCAGLASWFVGTKEPNQAMQRNSESFRSR